MERDLFIQNKILNQIEQLRTTSTASVYEIREDVYTPDGMVPYCYVEIIGKVTSNEAQTIKSIISEKSGGRSKITRPSALRWNAKQVSI